MSHYNLHDDFLNVLCKTIDCVFEIAPIILDRTLIDNKVARILLYQLSEETHKVTIMHS